MPHSKISTIHHGLDRGRFLDRCADDRDWKNKYNINSDYVLCVANNVLNKNLEGLIRAFGYLQENYRISEQLVIVGNTGFTRKRKQWLCDVLSKHPYVVHTGYVDHRALPSLYKSARVFVLPSFCESFGIPLLEAMASGVPVVTSNCSAMPEVVGDAGIMVDPHNFQEIGEAIFRLLKDDDLRRNMVRRGLERVHSFTWDKTARATLEAFQETYNS